MTTKSRPNSTTTSTTTLDATPIDAPEVLLTAQEAAERLQVGVKDVHAYRRRGLLAAVRTRHGLRFYSEGVGAVHALPLIQRIPPMPAPPAPVPDDVSVPVLLSVQQVADKLGVDRARVYAWIRLGRLEAISFGTTPGGSPGRGGWRITPEAVRVFCATPTPPSQAAKPEPPRPSPAANASRTKRVAARRRPQTATGTGAVLLVEDDGPEF